MVAGSSPARGANSTSEAYLLPGLLLVNSFVRQAGGNDFMKQVRVGQVGCGFYAQNHLHAWQHMAPQGVVLAAVCDIDPQKAEAAGKKFGVPHYTDAAKMFAAEKLDLVDISTRMDTHLQLAKLACENKLACIVQKPFAPKWDDCVAIVEAAKKHSVWLAVHENFRFMSTMQRAKAVIDSGAIGTPNWARISFRTMFDVYRGQPYLAKEERLIILDVGVHVFDLARWFLGDVKHLACEAQQRRTGIRGEDTATMLLKHVGGAVSVVECTYESKKIPDNFPETLMEIEGTEGSVLIKRGEMMSVTTQGITYDEHVSSPLLPWTSRPWHASQESVLRTNEHMVDCFRKGLPAGTSGEDSLKTFALSEAAYESARTGKTVVPRSWLA
jgi:D-apiose dehydrogenase